MRIEISKGLSTEIVSRKKFYLLNIAMNILVVIFYMFLCIISIFDGFEFSVIVVFLGFVCLLSFKETSKSLYADSSL